MVKIFQTELGNLFIQPFGEGTHSPTKVHFSSYQQVSVRKCHHESLRTINHSFHIM